MISKGVDVVEEGDFVRRWLIHWNDRVECDVVGRIVTNGGVVSCRWEAWGSAFLLVFGSRASRAWGGVRFEVVVAPVWEEMVIQSCIIR